MNKTIVQIIAPPNNGKTSLAVILYDLLSRHGIPVKLQKADPQIDEKLADIDNALERCKDMNIIIMEMNTGV